MNGMLMPRDKAAGLKCFRDAMSGLHYSIVDVSGGQTVLSLRQALAVLMKGAAVDVHDSAFAVGKVVGTAIAKSRA